MEQFSLEKYLENQSRKVVTRDGRPVRILDYNLKGDKHICIAVDDEIQESITAVDINGHCLIDGNGWHESNFDLFFADEEEELTEFEKQLGVYIYFTKLSCEFNKEEKKYIRDAANTLLNLARKELEKDIEHSAVEFAKSYMEDVNPSFEKVKESEELWKWKMSCLKGVNKAYAKGKQDALKDLPKWKKITRPVQKYLGCGFLSWDGYYLSIQELKDKLPKEE